MEIVGKEAVIQISQNLIDSFNSGFNKFTEKVESSFNDFRNDFKSVLNAKTETSFSDNSKKEIINFLKTDFGANLPVSLNTNVSFGSESLSVKYDSSSIKEVKQFFIEDFVDSFVSKLFTKFVNIFSIFIGNNEEIKTKEKGFSFEKEKKAESVVFDQAKFQETLQSFNRFLTRFDTLVAVPISEMLLGPFSKVLKDVIGTPITSFFKDKFIKSFGSFVKDSNKDIPGLLKGVRTTTEGIFKLLKSYFTSKAQEITPINKEKGNISSFIDKTKAFFTETLPKLLPALAPVLGTGAIVGSGILFFIDFKKAGGVERWRKGDTKDKTNLILDTMFGAKAEYQKLAPQKFMSSGLKQALKWGLLGAGIGLLAGGPTGALGGFLIGALIGYTGAFVKYYKESREFLKVIDEVSGFFTNVWNGISAFFVSMYEKVAEFIPTLISKVGEFFTTNVVNVVAWVKDKIDFVKEFGNAILETSKLGLKSVLNWINEKVAGISDWLKTQKTKASELFKTISDSVINVVMPIIDSILEPFRAVAIFFRTKGAFSTYLAGLAKGEYNFFDIFDLDSKLYSDLAKKGIVVNTGSSTTNNTTQNSTTINNNSGYSLSPTTSNPTSGGKK